MDTQLFHKGTSRVIRHWVGLAEGGTPRRSEFDPMAVSDLLPQAFMLGRSHDEFEVRLAGELLYDLHGRSIRGEAFTDLFAPASRLAAHRAALQAVREGAPMVLKTLGRNEEHSNLALEILLAPMIGPTGRTDRLLGLYQPTSRVASLHGLPLIDISLRASVLAVELPRRPALSLATVDGRRIA